MTPYSSGFNRSINSRSVVPVAPGYNKRRVIHTLGSKDPIIIKSK